MFSYIKGPLTEVFEDVIVVEAGHIGWNIHVPFSLLEHLPHIGEEVKVYTAFQVREDAMTLYGFLSRQDLQMFRMLLGVNGIGPKAALGILSTMRPEALRMAIISEDAKSIARAPGIGPKTAKRIILDLKDRIKTEDLFYGGTAEGDLEGRESLALLPAEDGAAKEAVEALVALGYSMSEASRAVGRVAGDESMTAEAILKASLKYLL